VSFFERVLLRAFGRPQGVLGRIGGKIMASKNGPCAAWVIGLLAVRDDDRVLEIGVGPGVGIQLLADKVSAGKVAGIDPSTEMVEQATARNAQAVVRGLADLRRGAVEHLPFDNGTFDKAPAINSMQVWQDPVAGLAEIRRVLKPGGKLLFVEHTRSVQPPLGALQDALTPLWKQIGGGCHLNRAAVELVRAAGFTLSETASVWRERWTLMPVYRGVAVRSAA